MHFRVPLQSLDQAPLEALLSFMSKLQTSSTLASASANLEQHIHLFSIGSRIHVSVLVYLHYLLWLNGVLTYIYHKHQLHVGKYTIHGSYCMVLFFLMDLHPDSQTNLSLNHLLFLCEFSVTILYPFANMYVYLYAIYSVCYKYIIWWYHFNTYKS